MRVVDRGIQTYLRNVAAFIDAADDQSASFSFSNPLCILSRLAKSPGFEIEEVEGGLLVDAAGEWVSVLPTTRDRRVYKRAVEAAIVPGGRPVLRVPGWLASELSGWDLGPMWPDYIGATAALQSLAGRKFKSTRQGIGRAERSGRTRIVTLTAERAEEAAAVARDWYRARASAMPIMYLEAENIWLFENLGWLSEVLPGFWGVGVEVDGRLEAVTLSCVLSRHMWCCYTERYRPGVLNNCNKLAFRAACRRADAGTLLWVNDGCSEAHPEPGVNNLTSLKAGLSEWTLVPFGIGM